MRPVAVGGAKIPLFLPALLLLGGVSLGGYLALGSRVTVGAKAAPAPAAAPSRAQPDWVPRAREGDREALGELRRQVEEDRARLEQLRASPARDPAAPRPVAGELPSGDELGALETSLASRFMALGRGYSRIRYYSAVIGAYGHAVRYDAHLADDPELLLDVRTALQQRDVAESSLEEAFAFLGSHGADMVFDLLQAGRGKAGMTQVVARAMKLVASPELRKVASEPLRVALELEDAKVCAEYKEVLPRALLHADERSLAKLRALRLRAGCGRAAKQDCFPCLRDHDAELEAAVRHATDRKKPAFLSAVLP
jgi:hypothetical protein